MFSNAINAVQNLLHSAPTQEEQKNAIPLGQVKQNQVEVVVDKKPLETVLSNSVISQIPDEFPTAEESDSSDEEPSVHEQKEEKENQTFLKKPEKAEHKNSEPAQVTATVDNNKAKSAGITINPTSVSTISQDTLSPVVDDKSFRVPTSPSFQLSPEQKRDDITRTLEENKKTTLYGKVSNYFFGWYPSNQTPRVKLDAIKNKGLQIAGTVGTSLGTYAGLGKVADIVRPDLFKHDDEVIAFYTCAAVITSVTAYLAWKNIYDGLFYSKFHEQRVNRAKKDAESALAVTMKYSGSINSATKRIAHLEQSQVENKHHFEHVKVLEEKLHHSEALNKQQQKTIDQQQQKIDLLDQRVQKLYEMTSAHEAKLKQFPSEHKPKPRSSLPEKFGLFHHGNHGKITNRRHSTPDHSVDLSQQTPQLPLSSQVL